MIKNIEPVNIVLILLFVWYLVYVYKVLEKKK